jgi:cyanuric acid amidohydrolase
MMHVQVMRIPMAGPGDVSGLQELFMKGVLNPAEIVAIMAKTEGNGCVNDFTRGYGAFAFQVLLAEVLGVARSEVARRVAFVMSGGTEGVLSPHATVFARRRNAGGGRAGDKRLAVGIAHTRDLLPEEVGRMAQVQVVAQAVREAMEDAAIDSVRDVHFVQIKCPLLTSERILDARQRGQTVVTTDTYESMGYSRGASALGVALALGEVDAPRLSGNVVCHDWSLYSGVASASAGVELMNCEVIVLGNSVESTSELIIGHDVMQDAIDAEAVRRALRQVGIQVDGSIRGTETERIVNVFAKAEADPTGYVRGRRHTMLNDSDINSTRHARAVVGAVVASVVGDPMVYVSGGAEHQGPAGGGPVAVVARA